ELFAWFLGLTINWRQRGIFLNYYMTFPVAYPSEVKNKILSSFRRGLQRSLPAGLTNHPKFAEFSVEERASEPAAFAAAALETLEIAPVDGGVAYAVFDFGGGTTDFDYGFYRLPTEAEADEWEHVLEHFGSSGDKFLGGENLLENLAYLVFCANLDVCRKNEIAFTQPLDALPFAGSELLITNTQAAYTNTNMMMSKLRPLWEKGEKNKDSTGTTKVKLVNRQGTGVDCQLKIKEQELIVWLEARIQKGLHNFFVGLKHAFSEHGQKNNQQAADAKSIKDKFAERHQKAQASQKNTLPKEIHILLAGNSSRSSIVLGLLGCLQDDIGKKLYERTKKDLADIFGDSLPDLEIHLPLNADDPKNPYKPTAKTGVALGLLRLCPGESLKVINHAKSDNDDSPFHFFVGTIKLNKFAPALQRGNQYNQWVEVGPIRDRIAYLVYTTTPKASLGTMPRGDSELIEKKLSFAGDTTGHKVFARAISPNEVEICTGVSLTDISAKEVLNNLQTHKLM
ncbi:MAG TPA: hypothetical protein PLN40_11555, partial [Agitococcus sp.]|nr:hypothetical protein [Agitococcus sp.]